MHISSQNVWFYLPKDFCCNFVCWKLVGAIWDFELLSKDKLVDFPGRLGVPSFPGVSFTPPDCHFLSSKLCFWGVWMSVFPPSLGPGLGVFSCMAHCVPSGCPFLRQSVFDLDDVSFPSSLANCVFSILPQSGCLSLCGGPCPVPPLPNYSGYPSWGVPRGRSK